VCAANLQTCWSISIPAPQDEDTPAAKKPRLEASTSISISTADDASDAEHDTFLDAQTYRYMSDDTLSALPEDTVTETAAATSSQASRAYSPRRKWELEEDAKLTEAITINGRDWVGVAALVPGRTNNCCRLRWVKYLDPGINKSKWTVEEDAALIDAVNERGKDWAEVAALVPGRNEDNCCRRRWVKYLNPTIDQTASPDDTVALPVATKDTATVGDRSLLRAGTSFAQAPRRNCNRNWSPEEDAKLTEAVTERGSDWVRVAVLVPGRTNGQCRHRWVDSLEPDINKGKWTVEEDAALIGAVKQGGKDWARVAALVLGRTNRQCRQRWDHSFNPDTNTLKYKAWTVEQDAKLTEAVTEFGNDWVRVAALVPGRTNIKRRQRWVDSLDPIINTGKWTVEEDAPLT
jgi:hypothetical protein